MKSGVVIALAFVAACSANTYTTENDDFDVIALVADTKALKDFVDCFNGIGSCSPVAASFKKDMKEAVEEACAKCTAAQLHIFRHFLAGIKKKLPADDAVYRKTYDPENKHFAALEAAVANA